MAAQENLIARQEWLEPAEEKISHALKTAFNNTGTPGQVVEDFLHGTWLGHPAHAVLTDVPVGAWTASLALDLIDDINGTSKYKRASRAALGVGLVGAIAAALTGITDWKDTDNPGRRIGLVHGMLNTVGVLFNATSWFMRRRGADEAARPFSYMAYGILLYSAYLGGKLVYDQKIGVDHASTEGLPEDFTPVLGENELPEGQKRMVKVNDVPVLLARVNGRIFALPNTCTHLGGPLNEGTLEGEAVRCPWHGSLFSLEDGRVLEGPTTHPEHPIETRLNNGQIEIRLKPM